MLEKQAKDEVIAAGKELVERGLVARTWGNVSCRIDAHTFAITPSGIGYDRLTPENIVVVNIDTLEYQGGIKPSSEKGIHAAAYRLDPSVNFVIHTHQTYATCLSLAGFGSLAPTAEEAGMLGGAIALAGYGLPGTKKLKKNVAKALAGGSTAVLMAHHGALITGADRAAAFRRAVVLETVCKRSVVCPVPLSDGMPTVSSRRVSGNSFEITTGRGGETILVNADANNVTGMEALHAALYQAYPNFNNIMHLSSAAVSAATESVKALPAILDDFAQMAGPDMRVCPALPEHLTREAAAAMVRAVRGRNAVCARGLDAVCCAADESDCSALLSLVEKNALAYLHTAGKSNADGSRIPALSWIDRTLMRLVYTVKYAKKK